MDVAFSGPRVDNRYTMVIDRTTLPNLLSIRRVANTRDSIETVHSGQIDETDPNRHTGFFNDGSVRKSFWYYPTEATFYMGEDKGNEKIKGLRETINSKIISEMFMQVWPN